MIDIIVTSKNNEINLEKTLMSIYLQEVNVPYIVTIIGENINKNIIDRYSSYFKINYIETNEKELDIKKIVQERTFEPYIVFIDTNHLFYNVSSLMYLYEKVIQENTNIQGTIPINDDIKRDNLNGVIYKRELLNTNVFFEDYRYICINTEKE